MSDNHPNPDLVYVFYDYEDIGKNIIENGYIYFPVDMKAQLIGLLTGIGELLHTPSGDITNLPADITYENVISDRKFNRTNLLFSDTGVNFSDVKLQSCLNTNTPYFNFYVDDVSGDVRLYSYIAAKTGQISDDSMDVLTNYIRICSIPRPPYFCETHLKKNIPYGIITLGAVISTGYILNKLFRNKNNKKHIRGEYS